jgi:hypothetical protein
LREIKEKPMADDDDFPDDFNHAGPQFRLRSSTIEKAVADERERCAKIAESYSGVNSYLAPKIAAEIRAADKGV